MAAEYTAIAKIVYQGVNSPSPKGENVLLTHVSNFAEAVTKIEKYYGTDIVEINNLMLLDYPLVSGFSDEEFDKLIKELW
jgi:hypothetical protein